MNWDQIAGKWTQLKGDVKQRWGKLTDDDLTRIEGSREKFVGVIQERYGILKEDAEREVENWSKAAHASAEHAHEVRMR